MKKTILPLIIFFFSINLHSAEETISYWNKSGNLTGYQNVNWAFARFEPEAPCYIKSFKVWVMGQAGKVTVVLLGHNAGSPVPEVFAGTNGEVNMGVWESDVAPPSGQAVELNVELPEPVWFADDQFFIGVRSDNTNLYFATDQTVNPSSCESESGGFYYFQSVLGSNGEWALGDKSFAADVVVDYPKKEPAGYFRDETTDLGFPDNLSRSSYAWADINNDGFLDALISGRLYINIAGKEFVDMTAEYGLSGSASGNAFVDYDNDGDLDIIYLIQNRNEYVDSKIYINNGTAPDFLPFEEKLPGFPQLKGITGFAFADTDNNGYPNLFISQLWDSYPDALPNYYIYNDLGNFTLVEGYLNKTPDRRSRGCQFVDFDDDGDQDLYVTNYYLEWDELYMNQGGESYLDVISQKNIDVNETGHNHGTGVDWYDYDNDGDMDLLLPQFAHPRFLQYDHRGTTIYKNDGPPDYTFTDTYDADSRSSELGFTYEETHAGGAWGDANNDGLVDFVISTFYGCRYIDFYEQTENHHFLNKTFDYGLDEIVTGEDAAWVDFDNDGRLDLAFSENHRFRLFKNYNLNDNNFFEAELISVSGNSHAIGARVKVYAIDGNVYTQEVTCGRGQKMQKPYRLHFGLGEAKIEKVAVRWPGSDEYEEFHDCETNSIMKLLEGGNEKQAPVAPQLIYPYDNQTDVETDLYLRWSMPPFSYKYGVEISKTPDFSEIIFSAQDLKHTAQSVELENNTTYYWRASAENSHGESVESEEFQFTTKGPDNVAVMKLNPLETRVYPNPFTDETTFRFYLRRSENVNIEILDVLGNRIDFIDAGYLDKGSHSINWDASNIADGIYFYRITAGNDVTTAKMVKMK